MAAIDKEIDKVQSQINQKLSQTGQNLDHLIQECKAKGAKVIQIFKMAVEELNASLEDLKGEFYDLLTPFYQLAGGGDGNNVDKLDLSQLQKEVVAGLVEDLEGFKKRVDRIHERVVELMTDFNVIPKSNEVEKVKPFEEVEMKTDEGFKGKENGGFRLGDVAIDLYGFPGDVSFHIESALGLRKLIQNDYLFHIDEVQIMNLDQDVDEDFDPFWQKTARERMWVKVKRLKRIFGELQKKIKSKNQEHDDPNVAAAKDVIHGDYEDPDESLSISFLRVIRSRIFHLECVLFDLIYELYHMLSGNQTAAAIFNDYKVELKNLMEINNGMVPITVYKFIDMVKNPREFKETKMATFIAPPPPPPPTTTTTTGGSSKTFHKKIIKLKDLMDLVHKIILGLKLLLSTWSDLSHGKTMMAADESDSIQIMLEESEDEVRDLEVMINWAMSELKTNHS